MNPNVKYKKGFSLEKYKNRINTKIINYQTTPLSPLIDGKNKTGFGYKISNSVERISNAKSKLELPLLHKLVI